MLTAITAKALREFAFQQWTNSGPIEFIDTAEQFSLFIHMCCAAVAGEEWAATRIQALICNYSSDAKLRQAILAVDTNRP